jgi:hypothetical protein
MLMDACIQLLCTSYDETIELTKSFRRTTPSVVVAYPKYPAA